MIESMLNLAYFVGSVQHNILILYLLKQYKNLSIKSEHIPLLIVDVEAHPMMKSSLEKSEELIIDSSTLATKTLQTIGSKNLMVLSLEHEVILETFLNQ